MFSIPCQQLARAYLSHGKEMTEEEKQEIFHYIPEEAMLQYTYYISDPVKNNLDEEALEEDFSGFLKVWVKNGIKYPSSYIKAFLNQNFGIWYLLGNTGSDIPYSYGDPVDEEHVFTEDSRIPWLKNVYTWFHYENYEKYLPVISMVFYMPFFCSVIFSRCYWGRVFQCDICLIFFCVLHFSVQCFRLCRRLHREMGMEKLKITENKTEKNA